MPHRGSDQVEVRAPMRKCPGSGALRWWPAVVAALIGGWAGLLRPAPAQTQEAPAAQATPTPSRTPRPPYLTRQQQGPILDRGEDELTPIQRAARALARQRDGAHERLSLASIRNLVTFRYSLEGDSEEAILEEARIRALQSTAARAYFENFYIVGLDLLEPYLRRNGAPFIARTEIERRQLLPGNRLRLELTMSVNVDRLFEDLQEKMFLARPELVPMGAVHLAEFVNGQPDLSAGGRARIERVFERNRFRIFTDRMPADIRAVDLSAREDLLREARLEAQRNNLEFLISGTLAVRPTLGGPERQILFDRHVFQEADVVLRLYRVDTGAVIAELRDSYSAAGDSAEAAIAATLDVMLTRSAQQLADRLRQYWETTMLDQSDYRLLISGIDRNETERIYNWIRSFAPGMEIYERMFYGNVAVINVRMPARAPQGFAEFLRRSVMPQFLVTEVSPRHIALDVL